MMYEDHFNIEEWKARKEAERKAAFAAQEDALKNVFASGQTLANYLYQRGRLGSHITSGNTALILHANPQACAVMSADEWNKYGRRINKGAVGIPQITRKDGYYAVAKVFDLSQTYGNKPYPIASIQENQFRQAINAFFEISPLPIVSVSGRGGIGYDAERDAIMVSADLAPEEILQCLPVQILLAVSEHSYAGISETELMRQTAAAVAVEVCGRLGLPMPPDSIQTLEGMKAHIPDGEERRALEKVRETAVTFGDAVCRRLKLERGLSSQQRAER